MIVKIHLVERGGAAALCVAAGEWGYLILNAEAEMCLVVCCCCLWLRISHWLSVRCIRHGRAQSGHVSSCLACPGSGEEGWLGELWVAPNGFFSFSFLSTERACEQTLKLAKVGAAAASSS